MHLSFADIPVMTEAT